MSILLQSYPFEYSQAMGAIHAILPDGKVLTNIDVFKKCGTNPTPLLIDVDTCLPYYCLCGYEVL